jgi:shikimate dehydrogenase
VTRPRAAVLGHPISHSKSPALHRAAYALLGVDMDYGAFDLTEEQLPEFADRVRTEPGWRGFSVTMPLKAAFVPLMDRVEGLAAQLGALNTVVVSQGPDGVALTGHNTDVAGITEAFRHAGLDRVVDPVIIGAGNTALAAVAALQRLGAARIEFLVRNASRAGEAAALARRLGLAVTVAPLAGAARRLASADAVVSTLPPHAADGLAEELAHCAPAHDGARHVLLDVAYDPWPSQLGSAWEARGGTVLHGLEMLVYQAVEQIVLFTGREDARSRDVIDVMCDSVGIPRRAA